MNIREQLKQGNSRANSDVIEAEVTTNPGKLVELMVCFFSDDTKIVQRAAMVVGHVGRNQPSLLKPWWSELVGLLASSTHPAVRRNVTRYFSELTIRLPKSLEPKLVDLCLSFVTDPNETIATAVFAMPFVADRADRFPAQAKKLKSCLQQRLPSGSAGFRSRGTKILTRLES